MKPYSPYYRMGSMRKALIIFFLFPALASAQKIDQMVSFRDMDSNRYFRFHYDNDYFAATDENYTQGYNFELVLPYFKNNPANHLFIKPKENSFKYGLSVEHIGFTPNRYDLPEIQFGDRPFAAAIMLKSFIIATDRIKKSRLTSSFNIGFMGPAAFGEEMQAGIHKATGNKTPLGWRHQIKNDLVLNYEIGYEKQLYRYRNLLSFQGQSNVKLGTLFTNASVGVNMTIGLLNSPFGSTKKRKGFKMYAYVQPQVTVVGYDATLQGGLFNRSSPYIISSESVERFTAQYNYGLIIRTRTLYFEYSRNAITKEFSTGQSAKWGGIRIGFTI